MTTEPFETNQKQEDVSSRKEVEIPINAIENMIIENNSYSNPSYSVDGKMHEPNTNIVVPSRSQ